MNHQKIILPMSFALFLVLNFVSFAYANMTITLAFENKTSYPNYLGNGNSVNWEKPGFALEFLKIVEKKLGIQFKFIRVPWKRCLMLMQFNKVDGVFNASYKKERLEYGRYPIRDGKIDESRRITQMAYVFFKLQDANVHWDGKAFTNLNSRIGTVLGYSIGDDLKKKGFAVDDGAPGPQELLEKLIAERFDIMAGSDNQTEEIISKSPDRYKNVVKLAIPYKIKPYYLMFSHNFVTQHSDMAEKIWDTIGKIRESPQIELIRSKYLK